MRNKKGFSLVELLIVVAIIGTLSAIGIPAYQNYQKRARRSQGTTLLNTCYKTQLLYHTENEVYGSTFFAGGTPIDPNKENFAASANLYYDLGIRVRSLAFVGSNGGSFLDYTNPINAAGAPGTAGFTTSATNNTAPAATLNGIAAPSGTTFACTARGNVDGDAVVDSVSLDQDNTVTVVTNDL